MGRRINDPTWAPDSLLTDAIQPDSDDIGREAVIFLKIHGVSAGTHPYFPLPFLEYLGKTPLFASPHGVTEHWDWASHESR